MDEIEEKGTASQWVYLEDLLRNVMQELDLNRSEAKRLFAERKMEQLRPMLVHRSGNYTVVPTLSQQSHTILAESMLLDKNEFKHLDEDKQHAVVYSDIAWSIPTVRAWLKRSKIELKIESHDKWMRTTYPSLSNSNQIYFDNSTPTPKTSKPSRQNDAKFIRLVNAPGYLGMNKNLFNQLVRPHVPKITIGERGIAFDRDDLDKWADRYKKENGTSSCLKTKPPRKTGSSNAVKRGTSTKSSKDDGYAKVREQALNRKRNTS